MRLGWSICNATLISGDGSMTLWSASSSYLSFTHSQSFHTHTHSESGAHAPGREFVPLRCSSLQHIASPATLFQQPISGNIVQGFFKQWTVFLVVTGSLSYVALSPFFYVGYLTLFSGVILGELLPVGILHRKFCSQGDVTLDCETYAIITGLWCTYILHPSTHRLPSVKITDHKSTIANLLLSYRNCLDGC